MKKTFKLGISLTVPRHADRRKSVGWALSPILPVGYYFLAVWAIPILLTHPSKIPYKGIRLKVALK